MVDNSWKLDAASGAKRAHTERTLDREATSRAKTFAREAGPHQHIETHRIEVNPPTIATLRMMLREEGAAIEDTSGHIVEGQLKKTMRQEKEARKEHEVSQSGLYACGEPFQAQALNFHFIHTLHAHRLQKFKRPFNCCFRTSQSCAVSSQRPESLVATIHLQFAVPTVF